MLHVVLYEPEIPPNTGNIIRLCANTGFQLHLIRPYGFILDDKRLKRAGLDYHEWTSLKEYDSFDDYLTKAQPARLFGLSTKGQRHYHEVAYQDGDHVMFGPESRGLPTAIREQLGERHLLRVPMRADSRSLNLSNVAALVVYEAWRQQGFFGAQ